MEAAARWLARLQDPEPERGGWGLQDWWRPQWGADAAFRLAGDLLRAADGPAAAEALLRLPHGPAFARALMRRLDAACLAAQPEDAEHAAFVLGFLLNVALEASPLPWRPVRFHLAGPVWAAGRGSHAAGRCSVGRIAAAR
jgi:hypothetical protein